MSRKTCERLILWGLVLAYGPGMENSGLLVLGELGRRITK